MRSLLLALLLLGLASAALAFPGADWRPEGPLQPLPPEINSTTVDSALAAWRAANGMVPNAGVFGVDVSNGGSNVNQWNCLRQQGFIFTIVRAYRSLCSVDPQAKATINAAWKGGMQYVDVYLFPAYACAKSAAQQVNEMLDSLNGVKFGMIWLDVENQGSNWSSNSANNVAWLRAAVNAAEKRIGAKRIGIYANANSWKTVMGNDKTFGNYPNWYAHYDGKASFSDWSAFGGWTRPAIKQFADGPPVCGIGIDHNWYV